MFARPRGSRIRSSAMPVRLLLPLTGSTAGGLFLFAILTVTVPCQPCRDPLRRLLEHVRKGMIHVVVVYRLEHLSANRPELAKIIELLYQHKVSLVSLNPRLNTSEPAGRLAVGLLLSFARFESRPSTGSQAMVAPVTPLKVSLSG